MEDDDLDLPRGVSGPPNLSISEQVSKGYPISYLITDHFHLWEQGSGNYHMGCTGFDFIRGHEADAWHTDPIGFPIPEKDRPTKMERHFRNIHLTRKSEADWFSPQVFSRAVDWLERNHEHDSVGHIPFIVAHPEYGHGERRDQLVQLVDIYPTVLGALNRPTPPPPRSRPYSGAGRPDRLNPGLRHSGTIRQKRDHYRWGVGPASISRRGERAVVLVRSSSGQIYKV